MPLQRMHALTAYALQHISARETDMLVSVRFLVSY